MKKTKAKITNALQLACKKLEKAKLLRDKSEDSQQQIARFEMDLERITANMPGLNQAKALLDPRSRTYDEELRNAVREMCPEPKLSDIERYRRVLTRLLPNEEVKTKNEIHAEKARRACEIFEQQVQNLLEKLSQTQKQDLCAA